MTAKTGTLPTPTGEQPVKWRCLTCEYVLESARLPFQCPRCGASRVKFVELKADGATAEAEEEA
jgi:rubrerythrin